jgi:hypothetical protein
VKCSFIQICLSKLSARNRRLYAGTNIANRTLRRNFAPARSTSNISIGARDPFLTDVKDPKTCANSSTRRITTLPNTEAWFWLFSYTSSLHNGSSLFSTTNFLNFWKCYLQPIAQKPRFFSHRAHTKKSLTTSAPGTPRQSNYTNNQNNSVKPPTISCHQILNVHWGFWFGDFSIGGASSLNLRIDTKSSNVILNPGLYVPSTISENLTLPF